MGAVERRTSEWVDLVGDLLARPLAAFPQHCVSARLFETFGCQVSWSWVDGPGQAGFELHQPVPGFPTPETVRVLSETSTQHPVLRWYARTGRLTPTTVERVPSSLHSHVSRAVLAEHFAPFELEHQLVIAYRVERSGVRAFVLARGRRDFSDEDVRVAVAVQPLLMLLDRQASVLAGPAVEQSGFTGRELAVLGLLSEGRTAAAIGTGLGISERTVHRHLQRAYRKLGAHDRVSAVLRAREAGIIP